MNLTQTQLGRYLQDLHAHHADLQEMLRRNGWMAQNDTWSSPDGRKQQISLERAIEYQLHLVGWRSVLEVMRIGRPGQYRIQSWARFQSPSTGLIYNYLEAVDCLLQSEHTVSLSKGTQERHCLLTPFFKGEKFTTWLRRTIDNDTLELVDADDRPN